MNERIRELELQCFVFSEQTNKRIFDREKFAELIVQECTGVCETWSEAAGWFVANKIEEHFGVK